MNILNEYIFFSYELSNVFPKSENSINFEIESGTSSTNMNINELIIALSPGMEIMTCNSNTPRVSDITGITGSLSERKTSTNILTISGIEELEDTYSFTLNCIRNPSHHTNEIYFTFETHHSNGYSSENSRTTDTSYIPCNYPCKTCAPESPSHCLSCYPYSAEVFSKTSYKYYNLNLKSNTCVGSCPMGTYQIPGNLCEACDPACRGCHTLPDNCTYCHPNTYLYDHNCIMSPCPAGYVPNQVLWVCANENNFQPDSRISVLGGNEITLRSTYQFKLGCTTSIPLNTIFLIQYSTYLTLPNSTTLDCISSLGVCHQVDNLPNTIYISGVLTEEYTDLSTYIIFNIEFYNPLYTIKYSSVVFNIKATESIDLVSIYQESNFILYYQNSVYKAHQLTNVNVIGESSVTATNNSYTFNFTNADYLIPAQSVIIVKFSSTLQVISTPPIRNLLNLDSTGLTSSFSSSNLYISGGFPIELPPNQVIQFEVGDIVNPYKLGQVTFIISISLLTAGQIIYNSDGSSLIHNIATIAQLPSFSIIPASLRTSEKTLYSFNFEIGDGYVNGSHTLLLETTSKCDKDTIVSHDFTISAFNFDGTNKYSMVLASNIYAHQYVKLVLECLNPPTTKPSLPYFLSLMYGSNAFYKKEATIPDMNLLGEYLSLTYISTSINPYFASIFTLTVKQTYRYICLDQLVITISPNMTIKEDTGSYCNILSGITGTTLSCSHSAETITIQGIDQLETEYSFELFNIRNPRFSTDPIYFNLLSKTSDGYFGQNMTSSTTYIPCNFPCKTCSNSAPDNCFSCYPKNSLVYEIGNQYYLFYNSISGNECVDLCPTHSYQNTATSCSACDSNCRECQGAANNCTKCYLYHFLYDQVCYGIYIYILIIYM